MPYINKMMNVLFSVRTTTSSSWMNGVKKVNVVMLQLYILKAAKKIRIDVCSCTWLEVLTRYQMFC